MLCSWILSAREIEDKYQLVLWDEEYCPFHDCLFNVQCVFLSLSTLVPIGEPISSSEIGLNSALPVSEEGLRITAVNLFVPC